jgi:hypothetical protein
MTFYFMTGDVHLARVEAHLAAGRQAEARLAASEGRTWIRERLQRKLSPERWATCSRRNPSIAALLAHADALGIAG